MFYCVHSCSRSSTPWALICAFRILPPRPSQHDQTPQIWHHSASWKGLSNWQDIPKLKRPFVHLCPGYKPIPWFETLVDRIPWLWLVWISLFLLTQMGQTGYSTLWIRASAANLRPRPNHDQISQVSTVTTSQPRHPTMPRYFLCFHCSIVLPKTSPVAFTFFLIRAQFGEDKKRKWLADPCGSSLWLFSPGERWKYLSHFNLPYTF